MNTEEVYLSMKDVLSFTVRRFVRRTGWDEQEVESRVNELFVLALNKWKPSKSPLRPWVLYYLHRKLLSDIRELIRYRKRYQLKPSYEIDRDFSSANEQSLVDFLDSLSDDSRYVCTEGVSFATSYFDSSLEPRQPTPKNYRAIIKETLGNLGWSERRVQRSFKEIQEALVQ